MKGRSCAAALLLLQWVLLLRLLLQLLLQLLRKNTVVLAAHPCQQPAEVLVGIQQPTRAAHRSVKVILHAKHSSTYIHMIDSVRSACVAVLNTSEQVRTVHFSAARSHGI
jgi:hypothetical protein